MASGFQYKPNWRNLRYPHFLSISPCSKKKPGVTDRTTRPWRWFFCRKCEFWHPIASGFEYKSNSRNLRYPHFLSISPCSKKKPGVTDRTTRPWRWFFCRKCEFWHPIASGFEYKSNSRNLRYPHFFSISPSSKKQSDVTDRTMCASRMGKIVWT